MSEERIEKRLNRVLRKVLMVLFMILVPFTIVAFWYFGNRQYYLCSFLLIAYALVLFFLYYEKKKVQARELVTLSVMSGIAVVARGAFIMLPHFKPMSAIIMITGIAFGPAGGFLSGVMSAFVSNFIFGQGTWTPWQMVAYGLSGMLAGFLGRWNVMNREKRIRTAVIGALIVFVLVGPLLDTSSIVFMKDMLDTSDIKKVYLAGLPLNGIHALTTFVTLVLLCRPMLEKLERMKKKYGMLG